VKIWGVLAKGELHIMFLPKKQNMNRWWYAWVIQRYFAQWLQGCDIIIQDFEKCLRCDEPMAEFKKLGVELQSDFPKCSQDLNAIENAWKILRERLDETLPAQAESREDFISRVRNAVRWINANRREDLLYLSSNQKERAADVLWLEGGRTSW
jgi:hypothetical protein